MTIPCLYWPLTVAASEMVLRVKRTPNLTGVLVTTDTTVSAGTYVNPDGSSSLLTQVESDFGTVNGVAVALSLSEAGRVTIAVSGLQSSSSAEIQWANSAATAALGAALGFDTSATDTAAESGGTATFTADYAMPHYWTPGLSPRDDRQSDDQDVVVTRTKGGQNTYDRTGGFDGRVIDFEWMAASAVFIASESGTTTNGSLERFVKDEGGPGKFRWFNDRSTLGSGYADYYLDASAVQKFEPKRLNEAVPLYSYSLPMWEYVS